MGTLPPPQPGILNQGRQEGALSHRAHTDLLPSHPGRELCLLSPKMEQEHEALAPPTVALQKCASADFNMWQ